MQVVRDEALRSYPKVPLLECNNDKWEDKPRVIELVKAHYTSVTAKDPPPPPPSEV
jgi:hypothetical protein